VFRPFGDEAHITHNLTEDDGGEFDWGYKLLACLILDYCNVSGKYGFAMHTDTDGRAYFVFSIPKIAVLVKQYYKLRTGTPPSELNESDLHNFFLKVFFTGLVRQRRSKTEAKRTGPEVARGKMQDRISGKEKSRIMVGMGTVWDYNEPAETFRKNMVVLPVSWVVAYTQDFQQIHDVEQDGKHSLSMTGFGKTKLAEKTPEKAMFYPSDGQFCRFVYVKKDTGEVNESVFITHKRRAWEIYEVQMHNVPVMDDFLRDCCGESLRLAILRLHQQFRKLHTGLPTADLPKVSKQCPGLYISECKAKFVSSSDNDLFRTWEIHQDEYFKSPSILKAWIRDELVDVPDRYRQDVSRYPTDAHTLN
jgi:hypothetical protein